MSTPLLDLLRVATPEERTALADLAGTQVNYLYQVATCERPRISARLAISIEDATRAMHKTHPHLCIVTTRELASMCAVRGL